MIRRQKVNPLLKKLKGFQKAPRARLLLLTRKKLTHEEFLLYEMAIAITDWDRKHDTYGSFNATNKDLAEILGWESDTTVLRHRQSLIRKGIFVRNDFGGLAARGFEKWELRKSNPSETKEPTAKQKNDVAEFESQAAKNKNIQDQNDVYPLVSFNGSVVSSNNLEVLSDDDWKIIDDVLGKEKERC